MAVAKHLDLLNRGAQVWNTWREKNPKLRPGLTGAKLSGRDFSGMDLKKVNLSGADLRGGDLQGARLLFTDLTGADLSDALGLTREQIEEAVTDRATRLPEDLE